MLIRVCAALAGLYLLSPPNLAQAEPAQSPAVTLIENVRIFDGKSPTLSEAMNVLIRGNVIEKSQRIRLPPTAAPTPKSSTAAAAR